MPTKSKSFSVLFLAFCWLVILLSSCTVPDTSSVSHRSRAVADTSSISHRTLSVGTTLSTYSEHRNAVSAVAWSPDGNTWLLPAMIRRYRCGTPSLDIASLPIVDTPIGSRR